MREQDPQPMADVKTKVKKGCTYQNGSLTHCIFCEIIAQDGPAPDALPALLSRCPQMPVQPLLHKDDRVAAFWTRSPECGWHILVTPVQHHSTVDRFIEVAVADAKQQEKLELLKHMKTVGDSLLDAAGPAAASDRRHGFHRRGVNSIDHMHLHCFGGGFKSWWKDRLVYNPSFSMLFMIYDAAVEKLQASL